MGSKERQHRRRGRAAATPEGARDWGPPALFRLLERGPTLSSSPRLASWGLTRGGLPARCSLGRNGFAKARRSRAGSTGRRADKEDDRPRGNPEGRRAWGASLCWASSPMTPRRLLVPPRMHPQARAARQRSPGQTPTPKPLARGPRGFLNSLLGVQYRHPLIISPKDRLPPRASARAGVSSGTKSTRGRAWVLTAHRCVSRLPASGHWGRDCPSSTMLLDARAPRLQQG